MGNPRLVTTENVFNRGPEWRVDAVADGNGGILSLSRNVTWTNSFSADFGLTGETVSAAVKFDVTQSESVIAMRNIEIPKESADPRKMWRLEAGTREEVHAFDIVTSDCLGGAISRTVKEGQARKFVSLVYNSYSYMLPP